MTEVAEAVALGPWRELAKRLAASRFRSSFHLREADRDYIAVRGWEQIAGQAETILRQRLAPERPANDGRQTPWRGHVVFLAQHATGCCCRNCLEKFHRIAPGHELSDVEITYVRNVLLWWMHREMAGYAVPNRKLVQPELF